MKWTISILLLLSFNSLAIKNELPAIPTFKVDLTEQLRKLELNSKVNRINSSPVENYTPLFILKSIEREQNSSWYCGILEKESPTVLYTLDLHTVYKWIPIDGEMTETQYWVTSP